MPPRISVSVFSIDSIRDSISALLIGTSLGFPLARGGAPMTSVGLDSQQPMFVRFMQTLLVNTPSTGVVDSVVNTPEYSE